MDVVLVDSVNFSVGSITPQLGLLALHSRLKRSFSVELINFDRMYYLGEFVYDNDMDVTIEKMAQFLAEKKALVYGFYTICNSYAVTVLLAKRLKQVIPGTRIIFGGPHATMTSQRSLESFDFIDAISLGESEKHICDFVHALISGKDNFEKLDGVCFRGKNGIVSTEPTEMLDANELSEMSIVEMLRDSGYKDIKTGIFSLESGRGCPYSCTFCSTNKFWKRVCRLRSINSLIRDMKGLHAQYGYKFFAFQHDHFTVNRDYLHQFCAELIKEDLKFSWSCSTRIDNLDYDSINLMKKAGCIHIFVGLETGSKKMQRVINKNIYIDEAIEKIIYIRSIEISVTVSFIYGFPEETLDDFADSMRAIDTLILNNIRSIQLHKLFLIPETKELEKVADRLYFDNLDIEFTILRKCTNIQSVIELIKQYPLIFSQFYTFASDVRTKYKRMDFLEYVIVTAYKDAPLKIKYFIKKYGIIGLYDIFHEEIEDAFQKIFTSKIEATQEFWQLDQYQEYVAGLFASLEAKMRNID